MDFVEDSLCSTECSVAAASASFEDEAPSRGILRDVGTKYGHEVSFHTTETTFTKATDAPVLVCTLRYATRERLETWGVPLKPKSGPEAPQAFPASMDGCPAPSGWN